MRYPSLKRCEREMTSNRTERTFRHSQTSRDTDRLNVMFGIFEQKSNRRSLDRLVSNQEKTDVTNQPLCEQLCEPFELNANMLTVAMLAR